MTTNYHPIIIGYFIDSYIKYLELDQLTQDYATVSFLIVGFVAWFNAMSPGKERRGLSTLQNFICEQIITTYDPDNLTTKAESKKNLTLHSKDKNFSIMKYLLHFVLFVEKFVATKSHCYGNHSQSSNYYQYNSPDRQALGWKYIFWFQSGCHSSGPTGWRV